MSRTRSAAQRPDRRRARTARCALLGLLLLPLVPAAGAADPAGPAVTQTSTEVRLEAGDLRVVVQKAPWRLRLERADGTVLVQEADPALPDPPTNPDRALYEDRDGEVDAAYPGLPTVSYQPLGYLRAGRWQAVRAVSSVEPTAQGAVLTATTSDGDSARVTLTVPRPGVVRLRFRPPAGTTAVEESFAAPAEERYLGGGQRFGGIDTRGRSIPLWISHGVTSDRYDSTNEIATPFLIGTRGWGFGAAGTARGEINAALPTERPDALNVVLEQQDLDLTLYTGTPQQVLAGWTLDSGRPQWSPPAWVWEPMAWRDQDTDEKAVRELVARHEQEKLPLGAVWIDNPFEKRIGDLAPNPERYADFDRLVEDLHAKGLRVVTWVSPYVTPGARLDAPLQRVGGLVTGTPEDDATYIPRRGLSPHVDFTDGAARRIWQAGLEDLIARGVDGVKADRGEEDLSDDAMYADGRPNRLNHNDYVRRYDQTMFDAFRAQGRDDDFLVIARGGYAGSSRHAAQWAGDNISAAGPPGLQQALNSLLSLSLSGFPWSGSDIGGYVGTRQDRSGDPVGVPTKGTYLRWAQLGALSPVMQTAIPAYEFDAETVEIYRRYAELHAALAPYTARAAEQSRRDGTPIVRPLPLAFPEDPVAARSDDSYLYGPDLLVAPIVDSSAEAGGPGLRTVHLPAGGWSDFWTGERRTGPVTFTVLAPLDTLPLYVRDGARLPQAVQAQQGGTSPDAPAADPTSPDAPAADDRAADPARAPDLAATGPLLPTGGGIGAVLLALLLRRRRISCAAR